MWKRTHLSSILRVLSIPLIYVFGFVLFAQSIHGQSIVINEFSIHTNPQVVELYNVGTETVNIGGWYLDDSGGTTYLTIAETIVLAPNQCVLVQGNINLNTSSSDTVRLFDTTAPPTLTSAHLIDSFLYTQPGVAGQTHTRIPNGTGTFFLASASLGLHNDLSTNCLSSVPTIAPTPSPTVVPTPLVTVSVTVTSPPTPTVTPITNVYLSEVMANPLTGFEWVELFNTGEIPLTLSNWKIDDVVGSGSASVSFSVFLAPFGYAVIDLPSPILNNGGDVVTLLDHNDNITEVFTYDSTVTDISWGREVFETESVFCLQTPSKGITNSSCHTTPTPSATLRASPTPTPLYFPSPTPTKTTQGAQPQYVYLSELYVNPQDGEHEKIELYNDNKFTVTLEDWIIKDATNQKVVTINTNITPYGYVIFELSSSKLNNSDEEVRLINGEGAVVDTFTYSSSEEGLSWARSPVSFGTWCLQEPSFTNFNTSCIVLATSTPTKTNTPTKTFTPTRTRTPSVSLKAREQAITSPYKAVLGASTSKSDQTYEIWNFTPQSLSPLPLPTPQFEVEYDDEMDITPLSSAKEKLTLYTILTLLGVVGVGFQSATIWNIFKTFLT